MQYLEYDVDDYICKYPAGKERDREIMRVAEGMLDCIVQMHVKTLSVHRDIKPPNFRIHHNEVYVMDFGIATEYFKDGQHIPASRDQPIMGSMRYVSHWTHEGNDLSRRDDIEMLIYSIMKLLGENPKEELW